MIVLKIKFYHANNISKKNKKCQQLNKDKLFLLI